MIGSSATHNFISGQEARRLRLKIERDIGKMEEVSRGLQEGLFEFGNMVVRDGPMVVRIDDFKVVLGMDFLLGHKIIPMPLAKCNPTLFSMNIKQYSGIRMISAL